MPLPALSTHLLTEVAAAWGVPPSTLIQYAIEERLTVSMLAIGLHVETGWIEEDDEGGHAQAEHWGYVTGPLALRGSDLWPIIGSGVARVTSFPPDLPYDYKQIVGGRPCVLTLAELVITAEERRRFEREHDLVGPTTEEPPPQFAHSADYRTCSLGKTKFAFGPVQAAVVRMLHEAAIAGEPWIPAQQLLRSSGSKSSRIVDLFKTKRDWRKLVKARGDGCWRLDIPETQTNAGSAVRRIFRRPMLRLVG